jgi:hypothetical protein
MMMCLGISCENIRSEMSYLLLIFIIPPGTQANGCCFLLPGMTETFDSCSRLLQKRKKETNKKPVESSF